MVQRTNKPYMLKTLRFLPELIEDMERVLQFTRDGDTPKYPSMNAFIVKAMENLIRSERRLLENEGLAWDSLKPMLEQSNKEEK